MKLSDPALMKSVLDSISPDAGEAPVFSLGMNKIKSCFAMMQGAQFSFRTIDDAEKLASFLSNFFPEPERVVRGLAEIMINAIEHGNLEIGREKKIALCNNGQWLAEISHRLGDPSYRDRMAEVSLTRRDGGIYIVVSDQGRGFDWKNYLKINPSRATETHGRGIAMANSISFDKLTYNEAGNKAVAYVADMSQFDW